MSRELRTTPVGRLSNDSIIPSISSRTKLTNYLRWNIMLEQIFRTWGNAYASMHLAAWNFWFPTNVERIIWLVSSFSLRLLLLIYMVQTSKIANTRAFSWTRVPDDIHTSAPMHAIFIYLGGLFIILSTCIHLIVKSLASLRALPAFAFDSLFGCIFERWQGIFFARRKT